MSASQQPTVRQSTPETPRTVRLAGESPLVLGRYRLHRRLGSGAFGTVWLARDERLDREVAVKIVPRERIVGGRFEREARAAARLAHPGIVTLYEAAVDDEGAYLVSELVRGATLAQLLDGGSVSDRDIVGLGIALCDAASHAHAQGVVHRDIKPSNVLVPDRPATPAQAAKLTDFGVARVIGGDSLTRTGDVVGTLAYMAPEQAEGLEAGPAADLYSLALVMYEGLTGVNPVRAGTAAQHARRLGAHLPPLRRQRRDLPRELGQGIDLALRPRPRERGSLVELRRALVAAHAHLDDHPGVAASAWPRRTEPPEPLAAAAHWEPEPIDDPQPTEYPRPIERPQPTQEQPLADTASAWPARALAGAGAAAVAGWLSMHVLTPAPLAPAAGAILAGGLTLALPRSGWATLIALVVLTSVFQQHFGASLVVLVAALVPVAVLRRDATGWPLSAAAPALGLVGLAGAWPALAARARSAWHRAALGLTGWVWLLIAGSIGGRVLYLPHVPGTVAAGHWTGSLDQAFHLLLIPIVSSGALAPAIVWAIAAAVLPWLVRGRSLVADAVRVVVWAAALVSGTTVAIGPLDRGHGLAAPPTALLGACASAAVALAPTAVTTMRAWRQSSGSWAGLA